MKLFSSLRSILVLLTLAGASLSVANAQTGIRLGYPGYNGNGCPIGSADVTLSPDGSALTLLFSNFTAQAGGGGYDAKRMDRKNCNISIPVTVPGGYSVSIITVDYRGFISVPRGGYARFAAEYFFAGITGPRAAKIFNGSYQNDYTITNNLGVEAMVWSPCGASVNLRVNSSMLVQTNAQFEDAYASVDSADFSAGVIFQFAYRRC